MRYKGFIIDADNTVLDFTRSQREALALTLGLAADTPEEQHAFEEYHTINESLWKLFEQGGITQEALRYERFRILLEKLGISGDHRESAKRFMDTFDSLSYLLPDAIVTLEKLAKGASLVMGTNGFARTQRSRIALAGIGKYFKAIVISEEVGTQKPEPEFFRTCIERLGLDPAEVLVVGDSPSADISGAIRSGLNACWFNPKGKPYPEQEIPPTYTIGKLPELTGFLPIE